MNTDEAIQRLTEVIRRKHLAPAAERSCCAWLRQYCDCLKGLPSRLSGEQKLEHFLTRTAKKDVAASTQNQAVNAILFFHQEALGAELKNVQALRARRPAQIRHAPTLEATRQLKSCLDPRTGKLVRWRWHEANVQRAVRTACRKTGLFILPHELRNAQATHCLNRGANPRAIQEAMGHQSLETTMGRFHAESLSVASPPDAI